MKPASLDKFRETVLLLIWYTVRLWKVHHNFGDDFWSTIMRFSLASHTAYETKCAYQWYAPPGIPKGRCWRKGRFVVGIFPEGLVLSPDCQSTQIEYNLFSFVVFKHLWEIPGAVHSREIWGICKRYVGGWYAGLCLRYGDCSIIVVSQARLSLMSLAH